MPDDVVVFHAHFSESVGSVLAHADAVAPAASGEGIADDAVAGIAFVDDKKLFAKPQGRAYLSAFERLDAVRTDDLDLGRPPRIALLFYIHVIQRADAANVSQKAETEPPRPFYFTQISL